MTVPPINYANSEDSDDMDHSLPPPDDIYRRKYQLLLERCEVLQQDNERIVHRIFHVKKLTRRYKKEIKFLMARLDRHGDAFRSVSYSEDPGPAGAQRLQPQAPAQAFLAPPTHTATHKGKRPAKRKEKAEKDPNAPKKPCNAFFQFCQEQRPLITADSVAGGGEPTKQEVTRHLAERWRQLTPQDKKVYVAMFERSKEKYAEEMSAYIKKE